MVPLTDWKERYAEAAWMVRIDPNRANGLVKPSAADTFQVRSESVQRFVRGLGAVPSATVSAVVSALGLVIEAE